MSAPGAAKDAFAAWHATKDAFSPPWRPLSTAVIQVVQSADNVHYVK